MALQVPGPHGGFVWRTVIAPKLTAQGKKYIMVPVLETRSSTSLLGYGYAARYNRRVEAGPRSSLLDYGCAARYIIYQAKPSLSSEKITVLRCYTNYRKDFWVNAS